jgi:hypothetical protein
MAEWRDSPACAHRDERLDRLAVVAQKAKAAAVAAAS